MCSPLEWPSMAARRQFCCAIYSRWHANMLGRSTLEDMRSKEPSSESKYRVWRPRDPLLARVQSGPDQFVPELLKSLIKLLKKLMAGRDMCSPLEWPSMAAWRQFCCASYRRRHANMLGRSIQEDMRSKDPCWASKCQVWRLCDPQLASAQSGLDQIVPKQYQNNYFWSQDFLLRDSIGKFLLDFNISC